MMNIAIASGKGGTGKTTIALALAHYMSEQGDQVQLIDTDVEEPNVNLFLKAPISEKVTLYSLVPQINMDLCIGCGFCENICEFSSIVLVNNKPLVFPMMCHSCGGCFRVCPEKAITEINREIGVMESGTLGKIDFIGGRLHINEPMSPPLIKQVKKHINPSIVSIIDSPPGTSCPVISALNGMDFVVLVTEPTPFGLHDFKLVVAMVRKMGLPFAVIINRSDIGDNRIHDYCEEKKILIAAEIPHSMEVAEAYSRGELVSVFKELFNKEMESVVLKIAQKALPERLMID